MKVQKDIIKFMFSKVWLVALGCLIFYALIKGAIYYLVEYICSVIFTFPSATTKLCAMIGILITVLICTWSFCCWLDIRDKEDIQHKEI